MVKKKLAPGLEREESFVQKFSNHLKSKLDPGFSRFQLKNSEDLRNLISAGLTSFQYQESALLLQLKHSGEVLEEREPHSSFSFS